MSTLCEPLESRMLLSASLATVQAEAATVKKDLGPIHADIGKCQATANHDAASLSAALRKSKASSDRTLLNMFRADVHSCFALLKSHLDAATRAGSRDLARVLADDKQLVRKPGDTAALARRATDLAALSADSAALTLAADAGACRTAESVDLAAIGAAHPTDAGVQAAIATAKTNATNCVTTLTSDQIRLKADISTFETDAASI